MTMDVWIWLGSWAAVCGVFLGLIYLRGWRLARRQLRAPVAEKLLHAPGESLRKKLEELEDKLSEQLAAIFTAPLFYIGALLFQKSSLPPGWASLATATLIGLAIYAWLVRHMFRLLNERRRYRLGLGGERAVGEELNRLMLDGAQVFHDVPNTPYGNVDHVLVAPCGVYAIETKARRKKAAADERTQRVVFDGQMVRFGVKGKPETRSLEQAHQQAGRLSDWLSKAVGEPVNVQPVLALPGWYVNRQGYGEVLVVSGREVRRLLKGKPVLEPTLIRRIVHQLDGRCRDVEF